MQFTDKLLKTKTLSEISLNIGQVFFASIIIDPLVSNSFNSSLFLIGLFLSITAWTFGLILAKE